MVILLTIAALSAPTYDNTIQEALRQKRIAPMSAPAPEATILVRLGHRLFVDPLLSGNRDISCMKCHTPKLGTTDGLPLSVGTGEKVLRRNAPALFNAGHSVSTPMFWDGRVSFSPTSHSFITPEPALNGHFPLHPQRRHPVAIALDSSLAAQALFPMVDPHEMMGEPGTNEIASAPNRLEAWNRIMARILAKEAYVRLLSKAFPDVPRESLNIGHIGTALAAFQRQRFVAIDTPFDRYLRGELTALSPRQKQGAALFVGKARCVQCHSGPELSNFGFFTTSTAQIGVPEAPGALPREDFGRADAEPNPWMREPWRSSFRVPPLRNVALTAPYQHDGSLATLREVVQHYNNPALSLDLHQAPAQPQAQLISDASSARAKERLGRLDIRLREPLGLTDEEIDALVDFLENGLTDRSR